MKRLNTKADREESRAYQFNSLLSNGYTRETYKDTDIFIDAKNLLLKTFRGTSTNHVLFIRFKSLDRLESKVNEVKQNADNREQWKAKQKENKSGFLTGAAECAAAIRTELKTVFPGIKFSVRSEIFAGGDAVRLSWELGPTEGEINNIVSKYQDGHFNGMEDIYEYTSKPAGMPGAKYITTSREIPAAVRQQIELEICELMDLSNTDSYRDSPEQIAYRIAHKNSFPASFISFSVALSSNDIGVGYESFFDLVFKLDPAVMEKQIKEATKAAAPKPAKVATEEGEIKVIEYSAKCVAIVGTKESIEPIREQIKSIGASFNPYLSCGAGWVLPLTKLDKLQEILNAHFGAEPEQQPDTLETEVNKTLDFFASTDLKILGEVTESTKKAFETQRPEVEEFQSIEALTEAAKGGQVISLLNMHNLLNANKKQSIN